MIYLAVLLLALLVPLSAAQAHSSIHEASGIKCGFSDDNNRILSGAIQATRPTLQYIHVSPSGIFALHYDRSGEHAVPLEDKNSNGVPDFIDSAAAYFDYSYNEEVHAMGYQPPPLDQNGGGTAEYDIYFLELGRSTGNYGSTIPEKRIGNGGTHGTFTTFITIDNDFSENDIYNGRRAFYTFGYQALQVTAAHEFHHAIQLGAYGNNPEYCVFHEMSSTWMEYRVYPNVHDYRQYLTRLFGNLAEHSFGKGSDCFAGYDYGILGQYLYKTHGDGFLRNVWEYIGTQQNPYRALATTAIDNGSTFDKLWCGFLPWLYHTGHRAEGAAYFTAAEEYPTVTFTPVKNYSEPSSSVTGSLTPLEFRFVRFVLPAEEHFTADTLDIGLANISTEAAANRSRRATPFTVTCARQPFGTAQPVPGTPYYVEIQAHADTICSMPPLLNSGFSIISHQAFPNPCDPKEDGTVYFPVPHNADLATPITLTVYNAALEVVYTHTGPFDVAAQSRVFPWHCTDAHGNTVESGVYIFTTECEGKVLSGKVAVLRR